MALNQVKNEDRLESSEIWSLAQNMLNTVKTKELSELKKQDVGKYANELESRNKKLKDHYPGIFNMILLDEGSFDFEKLKWMLSVLGQRKTGQLSNQESDNMVTFRQFDEEVKPKIDWDKEKPNYEKYDKYLK